jgi:hypothetical protein
MVDDGSLVEIDIDLSHPQASTIRAISPSVYRKRRGQAILGIAKKMLGDLANAV